MVLVLLAIGMFHPKSGADVLGWKPTRSPQLEAELELEDVAQMLEARNDRRRRLGLPEVEEEDVERRVRQDREFMDAYRARVRGEDREGP